MSKKSYNLNKSACVFVNLYTFSAKGLRQLLKFKRTGSFTSGDMNKCFYFNTLNIKHIL
jgi:hypothetical protein